MGSFKGSLSSSLKGSLKGSLPRNPRRNPVVPLKGTLSKTRRALKGKGTFWGAFQGDRFRGLPFRVPKGY